MKSITSLIKYFPGMGKLATLTAGIILGFSTKSDASQRGTTTGGAVPCDQPGIEYVYNYFTDGQEGPRGAGIYEKRVVYNGDCTSTITYTFNGVPYQGPDTWPVFGSCGCAASPNSLANGLAGDATVNLASINPADFTVVTLASNVDHFTLYNLDDGTMVANSGPLASNLTSFTFSNSILLPGGNYVATACTADDIIQGGASFRAGAGVVTPLPQIHDWDNETNLPLVSISAFAADNLFRGIMQLPDKSVIRTTGGRLLGYTNSLSSGYNLLVNQLDHGSNTADVVFSNSTGLLDGCSLLLWNCSSYVPSYFDSTSATGFSDGVSNELPAPVLIPGLGFIFNNQSGGALSLTFTGTPHVPVLPVQFPCGSGQASLLGRQTNDLGDYANITGFAPRENVREEIWNGSGYDVYIYTGGSWSPATPPNLPVGVSAFFYEPNSAMPPVIAQQPANLAVTQGQSAAFSVLSTGPGPLTYQWFCGGLPVGGTATTSGYTIANAQLADAGSYLVVVANAFGSVTSAPAILAVSPANTAVLAGLQYQALGNASFSVQSNNLTLGNIGSSGQDGVALDARLGLNLLWNDLTSTNPWVPGTFFEWQYVNRNGGSNNVVGHMRSVQSGNAINMLADFSALGATNFNLQFYNQGALIAERSISAGSNGSTLLWAAFKQSGGGGGSGGTNGGGSTDVHVYHLQDLDGYGHYSEGGVAYQVSAPGDLIPGLNSWFDYNEVTYSGSGGLVVVPGIGPVDTVGWYIDGGVPLYNSYDTLQLSAANLTNITFADASINPFGLPTHALGQAQFGVASNLFPVILNIGSSGQDGVSIALGKAGGWDGAWLPVDNSQLPAGAFLQTQLTGNVNASSNAVIATMRTIQGSNSVSLLTDFSGLGASTVRCDYYRYGTLVATTSGQPASDAMIVNNNQITTDAHYSIIGSAGDASQGSETPCTEPGYPCLFAGYTFNVGNPALMTVSGTQIFVDMIKVHPENATATNVGGAMSVTIKAAQIPSLTITNLQLRQLRPALFPLTVLPNGNVKVTWSNGILQSTTSLQPPVIWTDVPGNHTGSYTTPATGPGRFFRVRQ